MGPPALTLWPEESSYTLPSVLNGTYSWASQPFQQDNLWSEGPVQYAVWVDDAKKARIARRIHTKAWETSVDLSAVAGSPLSAVFADDSHNVICVGVDERGYVHVAGNHHSPSLAANAEPLKYMRTTQPGGLAAWTTGMVGTQEGNVTYPQFVRQKTGPLLFFYRDGMSGDGDLILNRFNSATKVWSRVAKVIDGQTDNASAYPQHIAVDRTTGRIHLMWTWRVGAGGAELNEDICYAYSDDNGTTWRNTAGSAYTLPITRATGEVIFDIAAGPILNNGGLEVDANGRVHAAMMIMDGSSRYQVNHLYHDGSAWQRQQVSNFAASSGRRPTVACFADGRVVIYYSSGSESGHLKAYDVTNPLNVVTSTVHAADLLTFEPIIDTQALYQRDRVFILACRQRPAGAQGGDPADLGAQPNVPVLAVR